MDRVSRTTRILLFAAMPLFVAGCQLGGSGLFGGFFGGGSESSSILDAFDSHGSSVSGGSGSDALIQSAALAPTAATIHNPEPGSMALFGIGMAGAAAFSRRRRKAAKRS